MLSDIHSFSNDEINKLGNTLIYLSNKTSYITKTKALKLLYFLDEISIKKYGIPFIGLDYEVWQYGPVAQDIYIELSDAPIMLKDYISIKKEFVPQLQNMVTYISPLQNFNDDEFTTNDISILNYVIKHFGALNANDLIDLTHRENTLWYKKAKENNLIDFFDKGVLRASNYMIDFTKLLNANKKMIYLDYIENKQIERSFNV